MENPMLKCVADWRRVVALSLSFWLTAAGVVSLILPELRFVLTGQDTNPVLMWFIGIGLLVASLVGRLFRQSDSKWREWLRIGAVIGIVLLLAFAMAGRALAAQPTEDETLAVAVPHIAKWEGVRTKAYLDIVGVPTICFGSTRGVYLGMQKSLEECEELLRVEVAEYRERLHRYFTIQTKAYRLTAKRDASYTSLAFNCGVGAIGKSTAVRRLNAGDIRGGCKAIGWWNKAGGRVLRGLVNRRKAEVSMCLAGL